MKVAVILRLVPDVVEELVIADDGRSLAEDEIMYITNELDEHALEQALLLKERRGARLTAIGVGGDEARDALATAVAKGADEAVYVPLEAQDRADSHRIGAHLAGLLRQERFEVLLAGTQSIDELDGSLGGILASHLGLPYVGGLAAVDTDPSGSKATVKKEFPGGRLAVLEVSLPAVLGIQAAEQPPRYAAVSRIMQVKKSLQVKEWKAPVPDVVGVRITGLAKPEAAGRAEMIPGDAESVAARIARLLQERGLL